ncbi:gamma-adaptin, putative [Entamoeba histolytica HM-1:IMSS-B]|uniref:AP-1 complex subunit gamma n=2 Tax=Entamoeba histolytica (strain ATCC 30459 / HM-1:IMSS / ABRM) TaxID=294381 RepID=C4LVA7_ENTH1|nr:gamma-adaptin, putative [Entamoeba histolytica HM-1:IMSS]EAL44666.2 gamma-adaptin, putative [Entamoeba histolytica HM-1:IMSS]EMH78109.1 gamma-adaptin, putative [Entamoeba histolytica HM-1:IMSS-B]|eukprot:XP_650052.2 gamma-adaptin, putative [Entamoeba histolytica HM-1:IMSS]
MAKLRELILSVRSAKTAAEEREIITKECAVIRSSMSSNNLTIRHRNVAKLIYIQLLGYPTQYGQMECLALISSHHYSDKRIGYLALMLLLDETQEVLTLVTNHLHNDLLSQNQFIVGLSLTTISNIGSEGIAQDVASEVEKLMSSPINYIKKKAAAAALRIIRKCPSYSDIYVQKTKALIVERQLSLQLSGVTLAIELCKYLPNAIGEFRKLIPNLLNNLKLLVHSSFIPDYDVSGITHPFLQTKLIQLLGILGHDDKANSSLMYSVLNFVIANTSNSRNVGNAILFETVKTILSIEADETLLHNAVDVLIKLLNGKDSNFKYVALEYLQYLLEFVGTSIQKHKSVIVECLKDRDHAIRKRALDLVYSLVNESNVVGLVKELLSFLQLSDIQFKQDVVIKICWLTDKFGPDIKWKFDSMLETITLAGDIVPEEVTWNFILLIQQNIELQGYAVHKLFEALKKDVSKLALNKVAIWAIGEYGDLLAIQEGQFAGVQPSTMLDLIISIDGTGFSDSTIKGEILIALTKLSARIPSQFNQRIQEFINIYKTNIDVELQQRAIEFSQFFSYDDLRLDAVNRMPIPENLHQETHSNQMSQTTIPTQSLPTVSTESLKETTLVSQPQPNQSFKKEEPKKDDLLDILGISSTPIKSTPSSSSQQSTNLLDLLTGPLPINPTPNPTMNTIINPTTTPATQPSTNLNNLLQPTSSTLQTPQNDIPLQQQVNNTNNLIIQALNNNGVIVQFNIKPEEPKYLVHATFTNTSNSQLTNFSMKVAVPKWIELQLMSPTSNTLQPLSIDQVTQDLILTRMVTDKPVVVKIKVLFMRDGVQAEENANVYICN